MDDNALFRSLIEASSEVDTVEIISDIFVPEGQSFVVGERQLAIPKRLYGAIVVAIGKHLDSDPQFLSHIGALIGSYDSRVWHYRKRAGITLPREQELRLCHLGLTANPKSECAFENIRWLLNDCADAELVDVERDFCSRLTGRRPRNALLWRHRVWLAKKFGTAERDLAWAISWTKEHPADSSAFYFMESLMSTDKDTLIRALAENTKDLLNLPGHESIWHHRRFLLLNLIEEFEVPEGWVQKEAPTDTFEFPGLNGNAEIDEAYTKICDTFGVDINLVLVRTDQTKETVTLDLAMEDVLIAIARSDSFPAEYERQKLAAEKHYRWLRCMLMRKLSLV